MSALAPRGWPRGDVDLGGLTPEPEHQLLTLGELEDVQLDTALKDANDMASPAGREEDLDDRTAA